MNFRDQILGAYLRGLGYWLQRNTPWWLKLVIFVVALWIGSMKL